MKDVVAPEVVVGVEIDKTAAAAVSAVEENKSNKPVARVDVVVDDEAVEEAPIDYNKPNHLSQRNPPHSEDPSSPCLLLLLHSHDHKLHTLPGS